MKRIRDYKKPKYTECIDSVQPAKKDPLAIRLPYDLIVLLVKYNSRFSSIRGSTDLTLTMPRRNMKNVQKRSRERSLYTNDRNTFITPIEGFCSLELLEMNSHERVDVSVLSSCTLRELSMSGVGYIEKKGRVELSALKKLVINSCSISFKAFRALLKQRALVDLEVIRTKFRGGASSERILRVFERVRGLRRLVIDSCNISEVVYYPIAKSLKLNSFCFVVPEGRVSFNISIAASPEITLANFDQRFYGYDCAYVQSVVCLDRFLDAENLCRLNIADLKEFHTHNTRVDKSFVESFLFRFESLQRLSFPRCHMDSVLLYSVIRKYRKTLRHLDVSHVVVPFDFLNMCRCFLRGCSVVYGGVPSTIYINQYESP